MRTGFRLPGEAPLLSYPFMLHRIEFQQDLTAACIRFVLHCLVGSSPPPFTSQSMFYRKVPSTLLLARDFLALPLLITGMD